MELNEITEKVIGCVYKVSNTPGGGFVENVYQNAIDMEIGKSGLLVEKTVLVELKAVKLLEEVQMAQCLNYLRATNLPVCLLINFYRPKVEIRRIIPNDTWRSRRA